MRNQAKQKEIEKRVGMVSRYIISNKTTIRETAKVFGVSKSTIHKDIQHRLDLISEEDAVKVKMILEINKAQRHLRGGLATQMKYRFN